MHICATCHCRPSSTLGCTLTSITPEMLLHVCKCKCISGSWNINMEQIEERLIEDVLKCLHSYDPYYGCRPLTLWRTPLLILACVCNRLVAVSDLKSCRLTKSTNQLANMRKYLKCFSLFMSLCGWTNMANTPSWVTDTIIAHKVQATCEGYSRLFLWLWMQHSTHNAECCENVLNSACSSFSHPTKPTETVFLNPKM